MLNRNFKVIISIAIIGVFLLPSVVFAKRLHSELWYIQKWCKPRRGIERAVLNDGTKCDCMTDEYVVEVEYANRWKDAVGKALHYSLQTGKRSTIVLIIESPRGELYYKQLKMLISYFSLPIDTWQIGNEAEINSKKKEAQ